MWFKSFVAASLLQVSLVGVAHAAGPFGTVNVGNWIGGAFSNDQTGAFYNGQVALYNEYDGGVDQTANAEAAVRAMGDADVCLLAHHGVVVVGESIRQAYFRATCLEWRCRQAYRILNAGGATPMDPEVAWRYGELFRGNDFPGLFEAMARRELREEPLILE